MEIKKDIFDKIESELAELLLHTEFVRRKDEKMGQLERSAYRLLAELSEKGPKGINALAEQFLLDKSTISRQTAALVSKGLIRRIPDPKEGRISLLEITPMGLEQLHEVRTARKTLYHKLMKHWPEKDRKQFESYLMRLNKSFIEILQGEKDIQRKKENNVSTGDEQNGNLSTSGA